MVNRNAQRNPHQPGRPLKPGAGETEARHELGGQVVPRGKGKRAGRLEGWKAVEMTVMNRDDLHKMCSDDEMEGLYR